MNNCMEYRGYHAAISFDADDGIFVGSVLGIADSLNFHGENVAELTDAFHNCVDGYLDFCREMGKAPDKEYKGSLNIRLSPEVHRQALSRAAWPRWTPSKKPRAKTCFICVIPQKSSLPWSRPRPGPGPA